MAVKGMGTWECVKESKCVVYEAVLCDPSLLFIFPREYQYSHFTGLCVFLCVRARACVCVWPDHSQWAKTDIDTGGTREEMAQESSDIGQLHIF